jgi:hypothetical protein
MDIDRNDEQGKESNTPSSPHEHDQCKTAKERHFTEVENAHASGLGSMGRSDEKVKDKDKGGGNKDVVY